MVVVLMASCRAARTVATQPETAEMNGTIAVAVTPKSSAAPFVLENEAVWAEEAVAPVTNEPAIAPETASTQAMPAKKRIRSFAHMKDMARSGEIVMSRKDLKTLSRLEKHYKGNFEQLRAEAFELTDKAKIIGGIGVLGLLIGVIFGSAFGWFLFVVAALAFLLRYLNIIMF